LKTWLKRELQSPGQHLARTAPRRRYQSQRYHTGINSETETPISAREAACARVRRFDCITALQLAPAHLQRIGWRIGDGMK